MHTEKKNDDPKCVLIPHFPARVWCCSSGQLSKCRQEELLLHVASAVPSSCRATGGGLSDILLDVRKKDRTGDRWRVRHSSPQFGSVTRHLSFSVAISTSIVMMALPHLLAAGRGGGFDIEPLFLPFF